MPALKFKGVGLMAGACYGFFTCPSCQRGLSVRRAVAFSLRVGDKISMDSLRLTGTRRFRGSRSMDEQSACILMGGTAASGHGCVRI